jgi:shikimate kinase
MIVLVIGPSGVGKSDYARYAQHVLDDCECLDLDALVSEASGMRASELLPAIGNDRFLDVCRQQVDALANCAGGHLVLVPVGAGVLQSDGALTWLESHSGPVVTVIADPTEVYKRGGKRNENRSLDQYIATEYSPQRQAIYRSASHRCDVSGLSLDDARRAFSDVLSAVRGSGA